MLLVKRVENLAYSLLLLKLFVSFWKIFANFRQLVTYLLHYDGWTQVYLGNLLICITFSGSFGGHYYIEILPRNLLAQVIREIRKLDSHRCQWRPLQYIPEQLSQAKCQIKRMLLLMRNMK